MMELSKIIGLKVVAIKGYAPDRRKTKYVEPQYLLFSDKKTIIELEEQDYYSFHDCSPSARLIRIRQDSSEWDTIMKDQYGYHPNATIDL